MGSRRSLWGPGGPCGVRRSLWGPGGPGGVQRSWGGPEVLLGVRSGPGLFAVPPQSCAESLRSRNNERKHRREPSWIGL